MKEFNKTFNRVFVTGDIHGDKDDLTRRIKKIPDVSKDDLLIILGDCGFFYYAFYNDLNSDYEFQDYCAKLPITILAIQGNHEVPFKDMPATKIKLLGGDGYESHGIYFAANGTELSINKSKCLVVGGAYSIDKDVRIARHYGWWENEELSDEELLSIQNSVKNKTYDFVFTHTCPISKLPTEVFLSGVDQSKVLNKSEKALERIKESITYTKWFCGHFHTDKIDSDVEFLFQSIKMII
jgi:3-oxoacid CoA-transferase subunit A